MDQRTIKGLLSEIEQAHTEFDEAVAEVRQTLNRQERILENELKRRDGEELDSELDQKIDELHDTLTERTELIDYSTPRDPTNDAIQNHAKRLSITPETLVDELVKRDKA